MEGTGLIIVLFIVSFAIYFLPTWIAGGRNHHQQNAIMVLNLFLGWTFVGWVVALVWAVSAINKAQQPSKAPKAPPGWEDK